MLIKFVEIPCIGLSEKISTKLNGAVAFSADRFKGLKWHKTKLVRYLLNKLTLKSAFLWISCI